MSNLTPTRRWVAILLSILGFGLGHFSLGRWQRGLVWLATPLVLALLSTLSVHAMTLAVVMRVASVIDCVWVTRRSGDPCDAGRGARLAFAALLCSFVLSLALRTYVVEMFTARSGSSLPTLHVGDLFVVDKLAGISETPAAGELIVFEHPCYPDVLYVSRMVAVPGQTLNVDANGFLTVDGRRTAGEALGPTSEQLRSSCPLTRYANTIGDHAFETLHCVGVSPSPPSEAPANIWPAPTQHRSCEQAGSPPALPYPWRVPEGHVFTLSDNRPNAADGRFWGFVPFALIRGPVQGVWWRAESGLPIGHGLAQIIRTLVLGS